MLAAAAGRFGDTHQGRCHDAREAVVGAGGDWSRFGLDAGERKPCSLAGCPGGRAGRNVERRIMAGWRNGRRPPPPSPPDPGPLVGDIPRRDFLKEKTTGPSYPIGGTGGRRAGIELEGVQF